MFKWFKVAFGLTVGYKAGEFVCYALGVMCVRLERDVMPAWKRYVNDEITAEELVEKVKKSKQLHETYQKKDTVVMGFRKESV